MAILDESGAGGVDDEWEYCWSSLGLDSGEGDGGAYLELDELFLGC